MSISFVFEIRNGLIVTFTEYLDTSAAVAALQEAAATAGPERAHSEHTPVITRHAPVIPTAP